MRATTWAPAPFPRCRVGPDSGCASHMTWGKKTMKTDMCRLSSVVFLEVLIFGKYLFAPEKEENLVCKTQEK